LRSRPVFFPSLFVLAILVVLGSLYFVNLRLAANTAIGDDFRLYWSGGRYFVFQTVNPYRPEPAAQIRRDVFGTPLTSDGYPYRLEYPFYILLLYLPFSAAIKNAGVALSLWMLFLQVSLALTLILHLRVLEWRPRPVSIFLLFLFVFFWQYDVIALLDGNVSLILGLLLAGVLFSLRNESDEVAGILLAFSTFKWEAGGPLILFILIWAFSQRRWRFLSFFGITLGILFAITTILLPSWLQPFLQSVVANLRAGKGFSTFSIFHLWWRGLGQKLAWGLTGILIVTLFLEWRAACRDASWQRFAWTSALTLAATPLLGLPVELANLSLLTFPTLLVLVVSAGRWSRLATWSIGFWVVGLTLLPWLALFRSNSLEHTTYRLMLLLTTFLLLALYWLKWWAVRPPRLWLDRLKAAANTSL